jgi:hypothetical protein
MTKPPKAARFTLTVAAVEEAIGPIEGYARNCHGASLALVRSGLLPEGSRVARGFAKGVRSQHSWALVAPDIIYDDLNYVVDITLWSYVPTAPRLYIAEARKWPHVPHGQGMLQNCPSHSPVGPVVTTDVPLSPAAQAFLDLWAPRGMDMMSWHLLLNGPMQAWPSREIVAAAYNTKKLIAVIPIDLVGMLTGENPNSLYF